MAQFDVLITAGALVRGTHMVPADRILPMYRAAVLAEMHPTVKDAVSVSTAVAPPAEGKRAFVEVKLGKAVKNMGFGAVTNFGMSYMFALRDAVNAVIENFEPPEEAWVDALETPPQQEKLPMPQEANTVGGVPLMPPQLDEVHLHTLAIAAQKAHFPDLQQIEQAAPQYFAEAKSFMAMLNAAFNILSGIISPPAASQTEAGLPPNQNPAPATE